jgi:hypothetical protein
MLGRIASFAAPETGDGWRWQWEIGDGVDYELGETSR